MLKYPIVNIPYICNWFYGFEYVFNEFFKLILFIILIGIYLSISFVYIFMFNVG